MIYFPVYPAAEHLLLNFKRLIDEFYRTSADHDLKISRLDDALHFAIEKR
jgi:hypothetical protein